MAKWVYIRGFETEPFDTRVYTACANAFISNVQSVCSLSVLAVDIDVFQRLGYVTITYEASAPIDINTIFPS